MADIKLFQLDSSAVRELRAESVDIEKSLQSLMEQHLESFLGVRFVASELVTGKSHGGRIARAQRKRNFAGALLPGLADGSPGGIYPASDDEAGPGTFGKDRLVRRLLCIAGDFTRYVEYAVLQIPRNIELLRYRRYGGDLLLLERVRAGGGVPTAGKPS